MRSNILLLFFNIIIIILCLGCNTKTAKEYFMLGQVNDSLGYYKKSFKAYSKAIKKDPSNSKYYVNRARIRVYKWYKNSKQAIFNDLNSALRINHWDESALYLYAYYFKKQFDYKLALQYADSVISRYPNNIDAYLLKAEIYYDKLDSITGNLNIRKALEHSPNKTETVVKAAEIQTSLGYYKLALTNWNQALNLSDKSMFCCYTSLSLCYWKINRRDSACYYWNLIPDKKLLLGSTFNDIRYFCDRKE